MLTSSVLLVASLLIAPHTQDVPSCMRATRALIAGAVPAADDLVEVDCGDIKPPLVVRYDADMRTVRLARPVHADEIIAAIPVSMTAAVSPGEKLFVVIRVGPVMLQREVEALQPANPGQKLFVRTADGQVMSALYPGDTQ